MGYNLSEIKNSNLKKRIQSKLASEDEGRDFTTKQQVIEVPIIAPGLNGPDGLKREHWKQYQERVKKYTQIILQQKLKPYSGIVAVRYERCSVQRMDWDNLGASFKCWGDALEASGLIEDDSPSTIIDFDMDSIKVDSYSKVKTRIIITKANEK